MTGITGGIGPPELASNINGDRDLNQRHVGFVCIRGRHVLARKLPEQGLFLMSLFFRKLAEVNLARGMGHQAIFRGPRTEPCSQPCRCHLRGTLS